MIKSTERASASTRFAVVLPVMGAYLFVAFVAARYWSWFVTPLGVPAINTVQAYGLIGLWSLVNLGAFFNVLERTEERAEFNTPGYVIAKPFVVAVIGAIAWGIGYLLHLFS